MSLSGSYFPYPLMSKDELKTRQTTRQTSRQTTRQTTRQTARGDAKKHSYTSYSPQKSTVSEVSEVTETITPQIPPSTIAIPIFVVVNPVSNSRRVNMERRITNLGLSDRTTYIPGGKWDSVEVEDYMTFDNEHHRKVAGCLLGHIRAIQTFLQTGTLHGCILEDDVLLRNDFATGLDTLPKDVSLVQLYTMCGKDQTRCGTYVYGTQGYLISQKWAQKAIEIFANPVKTWPKEYDFKTSEAFTIHSQGIVLGENPLVIEDGLSFTINRYHGHHRWQQIASYRYNISLYLDCDPEFRLPSDCLEEIFDSLFDLDPSDLKKILSQTSEIVQPTESLLFYCLHMLCAHYLEPQDLNQDKNGQDKNSQYWADQFFRAISTGQFAKTIEKFYDFFAIVAEWYSPSFPEKFPAIMPNGLQSPTNWVLIPNAPVLQCLE